MSADRLINRPQLEAILRAQAESSAEMGELALALCESLLNNDAPIPHHLDEFGSRLRLTRESESVARLQELVKKGMLALAQSMQGLGLADATEQVERTLEPLNPQQKLALYTFLRHHLIALEPAVADLLAQMEDSEKVLNTGSDILRPRDVSEDEQTQLYALLLGE